MMTVEDIDVLEQWWVEKSRVNFFAYRTFMRANDFMSNWFIKDLCKHLQQFFIDFLAGKRPILAIQTPPQHGKSWSINDFITWAIGKLPWLRVILATFSDTLGVRANLHVQRFLDTPKYQKIFPDTMLSNTKQSIGAKARRVNNLLEFVGQKGYFRNTTVGGPVTGESLDLGIIDDPIKGREQANSKTYLDKIWNWFTDDFSTRFSEDAGLLIIMTRWNVNDLVGKLIKKKGKAVKVLNYPAMATKDELYREAGDPLFPELKSLEFLQDKKDTMAESSWVSLYQGNPTIAGGNLFKDVWWKWWTVLPPIAYKFIVADTAQKTKTHNDWTVFQCWGMGLDRNIYLLDMLRAKFQSPTLRREAKAFYGKHRTPRVNIGDPTLRALYIEDKSSGSGLIQELEEKNLNIRAVQRHTDKIFRAEDASPYIEAGRVFINEDVADIGVLTSEAREFPNGEFDDVIDTCISAIEIAFINADAGSDLESALEAD